MQGHLIVQMCGNTIITFVDDDPGTCVCTNANMLLIYWSVLKSFCDNQLSIISAGSCLTRQGLIKFEILHLL